MMASTSEKAICGVERRPWEVAKHHAAHLRNASFSSCSSTQQWEITLRWLLLTLASCCGLAAGLSASGRC